MREGARKVSREGGTKGRLRATLDLLWEEATIVWYILIDSNSIDNNITPPRNGIFGGLIIALAGYQHISLTFAFRHLFPHVPILFFAPTSYIHLYLFAKSVYDVNPLQFFFLQIAEVLAALLPHPINPCINHLLLRSRRVSFFMLALPTHMQPLSPPAISSKSPFYYLTLLY